MNLDTLHRGKLQVAVDTFITIYGFVIGVGAKFLAHYGRIGSGNEMMYIGQGSCG
jgi:hypothetical protein